MDVERSTRAVIDSGIDREIDLVLAVDPSPEFRARIRNRIANEPPPAEWHSSAWFVPVGVIVATILVVIVVTRSDRKPDAASVAREQVSVEPVANPTLPAIGSSVPPALSASTKAHSTVSKTASSVKRINYASLVHQARDAEVLVPGDDAEGLRILLESIRERRVDLASLMEEPRRAIVALQPPSEIVISIIATEPIEPRAR